VPPVPPPPPPLVLKADWEAAVQATHVRSSVKTDKDGITEFAACFGKSEDGKKCDLFSFGKKDAFRHLTTYTPTGSGLARFSASKYLHSYVSLPDCKRPVVVLSPHFFSKGGWLFMNKVAVMADGELVLERHFENAEVQRDAETWGVDERAVWVASSSDMGALRRIASASAVIVRLTGSKGYTTVPDKDVRSIKEDFATVLAVFAVLDNAAAKKDPVDCK
jgi:hypothetical protein